jgi:hypothetical protein
MSGFLAEYAGCFPAGERVRVGIPLAAGGAFQEWGVVCSLERDLLELELSRDFLPQEASLALGRTLDLRLPDAAGERCCRGVLVGGTAGRLALRLVDGVVPYEPREYFRQDVYLPVDYRLPPLQNPGAVRESWLRGRRDQEFAAQKPEPGEPAELAALREEIRARLGERPAAPPAAANISGGGVRLSIPQRLTPGLLIELSIYLPHPAKRLEIVGQVVEVKPGPGRGHFSTALYYRFIDEADRDRIIGYIAREQSAQLSRLRREAGPAPPDEKGGSGRGALRRALGILILALLTAFLVHSVLSRRGRGEKHEIERIFEEGIARHLTGHR